jgi:ribonuclease HI
MITIYVDGAAKDNPGRGGYGIILMYGPHKKEISQGYRLTTNNRMELMAVIAALQALKNDNQQVTIYSDSKYVVDAVEKGWLSSWLKTNFKGDKKNPDLWKLYASLAKKHHVKFVWVKGHADNIYNNRCDELASAAANGNELLIDEVYEQLHSSNGSLF